MNITTNDIMTEIADTMNNNKQVVGLRRFGDVLCLYPFEDITVPEFVAALSSAVARLNAIKASRSLDKISNRREE